VGCISGCGTAGVPRADGSADGGVDHEQAKLIAQESAKAVGLALLAARPAADLQAIYEAGLPHPVCPQTQPDFNGDHIDLSLDYGTGCVATYASGPEFAGRLSGSYTASTHTFDLTLENVQSIAGLLEGTVSGRVEPNVVEQTFYVSVIANLSGWSIQGTAIAEVELAEARLRITQAQLLSTRAGRYNVTLNDARFDIGSFQAGASAGTARVMSVSEENTLTDVPATVVDFGG
jgi:hypothetical protein